MMNKTAMAALIISRIQGLNTPAAALQTFADAINDYIKDNAEFTFSWDAKLAVFPFTVDPVIVATGEFILLEIVFTQSMATTPAAARNHIRNEIIAGMTAATYNITAPGFSTAPASMSSSPNLQNLVLEYYGETQQEAMEDFSDKVITWVKQLAPSAPCAGSHGSYVGEGTVTAIS